jgi:RNA polymerase-binding transcription factor
VTLDLDALRRTLEEERAALTAELGALTAVSRDPAATIGFGKRVGEGTSQAIERIERVGQADVLTAKLGDVERALSKFAEGTYGICDRCGAAIPDERLEARPWSVLCVRCSAARSDAAERKT